MPTTGGVALDQISTQVAPSSVDLVTRDEVREVLMVPPAITRVPGAKSWVRGLANVRGHLLPLVDLREFLGSGVGGTERSARALVANSS
jgi:twitching motility protein PilI